MVTSDNEKNKQGKEWNEMCEFMGYNLKDGQWRPHYAGDN